MVRRKLNEARNALKKICRLEDGVGMRDFGSIWGKEKWEGSQKMRGESYPEETMLYN